MEESGAAAFFDGIAEQWDGWEDLDTLRGRLLFGLDEFGVGEGETVLDVGCGTGNLTLALLEQLSERGRVLAVDLSPAMLAVAGGKVRDPRVEWFCGDAGSLPWGSGTVDRAICFSVWPHFADPAKVAREFRRLLRGGGALHVWHLTPREKVNAIHAAAGEAVRGHALAPARETAALLAGLGFRIGTVRDDDGGYLVTAVKPEGGEDANLPQ